MQINADTMFKIRKVYRLTQAEIGALCNVTDAYINMIERGKRPITEHIRRKIIEELALTPEKLERLLAIFDETEPPKTKAKNIIGG